MGKGAEGSGAADFDAWTGDPCECTRDPGEQKAAKHSRGGTPQQHSLDRPRRPSVRLSRPEAGSPQGYGNAAARGVVHENQRPAR
jgi:hypothetical protein